MDTIDKTNNIVLLFDFFSQSSMDLWESFKNAGYDCPAVVINTDGFLPDGVISPYEYYCDLSKACEKADATPLYFNQVPVPKYWEISGTNNQGEIHDKSKLRGRIFYTKPYHKRLVSVVDWFDEKGVARCCDHYNKYGVLFARTILNKYGQRVNKSYFDADGKEIIVENFITGDIIYNSKEKIQIFRNQTEFVFKFFTDLSYNTQRVFFNSLSYPFFVSNMMKNQSEAGSDLLFWQEPIEDEIPGNMQMILSGESGRCKQIVVQSRKAYDRLLKLGVDESKLMLKGYIYSFNRENALTKNALICTNSEDVLQLEYLAKACPQIVFHVAALTEMSAKLMAHDSYENIHLYPNISMRDLDRLFMTCDIYLDINMQNEIVDACRRAFLGNQLIFAFSNTLHNDKVINPANIFNIEAVDTMTEKIKAVLSDYQTMQQELELQKDYALTEQADSYRFS